MPCYEPSYSYSKADCILCSIFHTAEKAGLLDAIINGLDYKLMGLTRKHVEDWWKSHKALDTKRLKEKH